MKRNLCLTMIAMALVIATNSSGSTIDWEKHIVGGARGYDVLVLDLDEDGDNDILGGYALSWWENNGSGSFAEHSIDNDFAFSESAAAIDIDDDNDIDVIAINDTKLAWWENDGTESFSKHLIYDGFVSGSDVETVDLDGDGDNDIVTTNTGVYPAFAGSLIWWENDGTENFVSHLISSGFCASEIQIVDMNGDGISDILLRVGAFFGYVNWYENDGNQSFTSHGVGGAFVLTSVFATDLDMDGDIDVLGTDHPSDELFWWRNNGSHSFTQVMIDGNIDGPEDVCAADLDSDGDMDVFGATFNYITSWENDGQQHFTEHMVSTDIRSAECVFPADLDNDGDLDILNIASSDNLAWWENTNTSDVTITNFNARLGESGVELNWDIKADENISGYNIYRADDGDPKCYLLNRSSLIPPEDRRYVDTSVHAGLTYRYTLKVMLQGSSIARSRELIVNTRAYNLSLRQNFPNPFNPTTTISFTLPEKANTYLSIFNLEGKLVKVLVNEAFNEGFKEVTWDGTDAHGNQVSSGVYFYRLRAGKKVLTQRMVLLK